MSYTWFRVDSSIAGHPKELELAAALKDPNAIAYVLRLWSWTQLYAPSGEFPKARADQLEAFCRWSGKRGHLVETLLEIGFLDAEQRLYFVHDWPELQGKMVEKSKRDAATKRAKRAKEKEERETAARAASAPGARTLPTDVTYGRDERSLEPPIQKVRSDQPVAPSKNRGENNWGSVAEKLAVWMQAQRSLAGNFPDNRASDIEAIAEWTLAWALKHEPDARAYDQMCAAFNGYLADPWAIERDCTLALWCSDNVGLHRWTAERAKEAA